MQDNVGQIAAHHLHCQWLPSGGPSDQEPGCVQVDILIVNCSLFNPTPSLSAMIVNHFKMKSSIVSYNLSGMGCSAGVISLSLARELLQVLIPLPLLALEQADMLKRQELLLCCCSASTGMSLNGLNCHTAKLAHNSMQQVYPNSNVLVVSTENITQNWCACCCTTDELVTIPTLLSGSTLPLRRARQSKLIRGDDGCMAVGSCAFWVQASCVHTLF